jgi:hypothetical protein
LAWEATDENVDGWVVVDGCYVVVDGNVWPVALQDCALVWVAIAHKSDLEPLTLEAEVETTDA